MSKTLEVPSEEKILAAYQKLQSDSSVTAAELVKFAQWVRFDPRLGEFWLSAFQKNWATLSPVQIRIENLNQFSPAVLGVLLDQYGMFLCPRNEKHLFNLWKATAIYESPRANNEEFFIGLEGFASQRQRDNSERPIKSYKNWGFFGRDVFINKIAFKQKELQKTGIAPEERKKILNRLLKTKKRIKVSDYILACDHLISKRVAQKDLQATKGLTQIGNTRSQFYVK